MLRTFALSALIFITATAVIVGVNSIAPPPTHDRIGARCTRACHDKPCTHFDREQADQNLVWLYTQNIALLKRNGLGLSYKEANLVVYVGVVPMTFFLLLWGVVRRRS